MKKTKVQDLAWARSGDKGSHANIGVIALNKESYQVLKQYLTEEKVYEFFKNLGVQQVIRYELPNLEAFNFVLTNALDGGGSRSLRIDSQGKVLGQALLQLELDF